MALGLSAFIGTVGYIAYMRHKYEGMGYYTAVVDEEGQEAFVKKKSRWDWFRETLCKINWLWQALA